jgi:hypothetical protein
MILRNCRRFRSPLRMPSRTGAFSALARGSDFIRLTKSAIASCRQTRYGRQDEMATSSKSMCISKGMLLCDSAGALKSESKQLSDLLEEPNSSHMELGRPGESVQSLW